MSREEIQKLLGGYAADTLSEAERRALFEAALEDQELFNTLAKEQALRDVLQDRSARQQLIEALGPAREAFAARAWHWLRWLRQPAALAMVGSMAALLIVGGLVLRQTRHAARRGVIVADAIAPRSAPSREASQNPVLPGIAQPKPFRPPAAHIPRPSTPLPAPPALRTEPEVAPANLPAAPPPAPSVAMARGALADTLEARRQMLQATPMPAQSFMARAGAPMAAISRAKAKPSAPAKLAVEYTLLLQDANGSYSPVPSNTLFHTGDSVRLKVEPSEPGYTYLFQRGATAGWKLVASQRVEKAQGYELPSRGGLQSDVPAQLELLLVLSRVERPAFDTPQTGDVDALASGASGHSAAVPVPGEPGVYLVDTQTPASQPQASFRIMIEYR